MKSDTNPDSRPSVTVLLCTWRAAAGLDTQLDTIAAQDWPTCLRVFDDASGDSTPTRIRQHPSAPAVQINPANLGFVATFGQALDHALTDGDQYIAFSDQDDIWHKDRISAGMTKLLEIERERGKGHPVLVHSDVRVIDDKEQCLASSFLRYRGYATDSNHHLPRILGQSGVLGNTILMNRSMAKLGLPFPPDLHTHDWWFGVLAELFGTRVLLDKPTVDYRLHDTNTSNTLDSISGRRMASLKRGLLGGLIKRDFRLPYMEDSRERVLSQLLAGHGQLPALKPDDDQVLNDFLGYLRLNGPRPKLLWRVWNGQYLKPSWAHRIRVAIALLVTRRYEARAGSSQPTSSST